MGNSEFNLLHEPWLVVLYDNGETKSVGLLELFNDAHKIRVLSGETSAQNIAILRLLLAIIYASHMRAPETGMSDIDNADDAIDCWNSIWRAGSFNMDIIGSYLKKYESRFYLFDDERPFYQVNIEEGSDYIASKLDGSILESNNKVKILTMKDGESRKTMSYPDAARWLVHLMAFDDNSGKPSNFGKKDSTEKFGSASAGWLARLGLVYAEGSNLFETLMMNLVLVNHLDEPFEDGKAPWELDSPHIAERVKIPCPSSIVELLTIQSRRIKLLRKDGKVTGYKLIAGDQISTDGALIEQMTLWRLDKENTWRPRLHDPARMFWRDFSSLLVKIDGEGVSYRQPGVVRWMSLLVGNGIMEHNSMHFKTAGLQYDSKYFFVKDIVDDGLDINSDMLKEMNRGWNNRVGVLIGEIEKGITYLGRFAADLSICCGCSPDLARSNDSPRARAIGYQALDEPFRRWLVSINPDSDDMDDRMTEMKDVSYKLISSVGESILIDSTTRVFTGKKENGKDPKNGFEAFSKFKSMLYSVFKKEVK